jgi:hypothetical protein
MVKKRKISKAEKFLKDLKEEMEKAEKNMKQDLDFMIHQANKVSKDPYKNTISTFRQIRVGIESIAAATNIFIHCKNLENFADKNGKEKLETYGKKYTTAPPIDEFLNHLEERIKTNVEVFHYLVGEISKSYNSKNLGKMTLTLANLQDYIDAIEADIDYFIECSDLKEFVEERKKRGEEIPINSYIDQNGVPRYFIHPEHADIKERSKVSEAPSHMYA